MTKKTVILHFPQELERGMAEVVQTANRFSSRIYISFGSRRINAKSIMGMMTIEMADGDSISIDADGADEQEAVEAVARMLSCVD